ncbi:MAG: hypothetical protein RL701_5557, partial [Pseudomonadota bacterium]
EDQSWQAQEDSPRISRSLQIMHGVWALTGFLVGPRAHAAFDAQRCPVLVFSVNEEAR